MVILEQATGMMVLGNVKSQIHGYGAFGSGKKYYGYNNFKRRQLWTKVLQVIIFLKI